MAKSYFYPDLGVSNLQATQWSDTICNVPALKIWQVPVYSANHWIDSFAHTVYDVISQQSINFITSMIQTYKNK